MNVAFIPVRGGSKSIPLKNIKIMNGKPLVYWTLRAACCCKNIEVVYIATDSSEIKACVEGFQKEEPEIFGRTKVIDRGAQTATDTASTESAMLEFAENYEFDNIVLIQATSPLLQATDLEKGFFVFEGENIDSVLSTVRQKRFIWKYDQEGGVLPGNYDVFNRPRRQEFDGYLVENGAFYITSREDLLRSRNRLSGRIGTVEMEEDTFVEIDEPSDWEIVEKLLQKRIGFRRAQSLSDIKMLLTDCDGCLTDGGMYYSEQGDELKKYNTKDGMGFQLLREKGIITGIVTGEKVDLNRRRAQKLKLDILKEGIRDKLTVIKEICREYHIRLEEVAYIGDDINDLDVVRSVGFGCSVADGMKEVKEVADYVTQLKGGQGAVREVAEMILRAKSKE